MSLTVLIVDDEENARHQISKYLDKKGYSTLEAGTLGEARKQLDKGNADIITLDAKLPDGFGPVLLEETAAFNNRPPIILITAFGDVEMAVAAMKNGAHDFFTKPIALEELRVLLRRAVALRELEREVVEGTLHTGAGATGDLTTLARTHFHVMYHGNQRDIAQGQRVAVARSLVTRPEVILADEPTGELDTATGRQIMYLFQKISIEEGVTVVMVTHDPVIEEYASLVYHLDDGQVSEVIQRPENKTLTVL